MDAYCVVAQAYETVCEHVGHLMGGIVGRKAKVHTVETACLTGAFLELEAASHGLQPPVFPGGRFLQVLAREVQCTACNDVLVIP